MSMIAPAERRTAHSRTAWPTFPHAGTDLRKEVALGTLAMSVVHDIRNPLAAIHVGAEMLKGSQFTEEQVRRLARNIYTASVEIGELLQEYVDRCRSMDVQPRPSDLRTVVGDAVHRVMAVAEAQSVIMEQDIPADLVVTLDRSRIGSVLANLLKNALQVMPEGGSIRISAVPAESSVVITVRDTGPGIPPEIRDQLFEAFITARKPNGWGLGLAQARQIVMDHGGEMWLEPASGRGACIAFSLPASITNGQLRVEQRCVRQRQTIQS